MKLDALNSPATEAEIANCERLIGRSIPEPYRSFLLRYNGGEPQPYTFERKTENGRRLLAQVRAFVGVHDDYDGIANIAEMYRGRVPPDLFPIATEAGGNLVLLGTSGERTGRIYYWDHNWEAGDNEPMTYRNVHPLADSFETFLTMLHDPEQS